MEICKLSVESTIEINLENLDHGLRYIISRLKR